MYRDFREHPELSPVAWCLDCNEFHAVEHAGQIMKTVFRVTPEGIYPYGTFQCRPEETSTQSKDSKD